MAYWSQIEKVVDSFRQDIQAELDQSLDLLAKARREQSDLERHVAALQELLARGRMDEAPAATPVSLHAAMKQVLDSTPEGKMRATDVAREINRRGLYRMRDGRPVEPQQIHARVGNYPGLFRREGTFIAVAEARSQGPKEEERS